MGHSTSRDETNSNELTVNDLELLKIYWDSVKNKDDLGLRLMISIFQFDQEIKKLWIFAANLETEQEMMENSQVRYHANKVISTIEKIVVSLTSSPICESDSKALIRLGKSHYHYGIQTEHFKLFEECFIKCLEANITSQNINFHEKADIAWRRFIRYIFQQYENGMQIEEEKEKEKK